jgi:hypothetical protein
MRPQKSASFPQKIGLVISLQRLLLEHILLKDEILIE